MKWNENETNEMNMKWKQNKSKSNDMTWNEMSWIEQNWTEFNLKLIWLGLNWICIWFELIWVEFELKWMNGWRKEERNEWISETTGWTSNSVNRRFSESMNYLVNKRWFSEFMNQWVNAFNESVNPWTKEPMNQGMAMDGWLLLCWATSSLSDLFAEAPSPSYFFSE